MEPLPQCPSCGLDVPVEATICPYDGTQLETSEFGPTVRRDPLIGLTLGEYVVEKVIGAGGMGVVYRAIQPVIGKKVAIKVLRPEVAHKENAHQLIKEARLVNQVGHRGIVDIFSFGSLSDGRQYLVMEYLTGASLERVVIQKGKL